MRNTHLQPESENNVDKLSFVRFILHLFVFFVVVVMFIFVKLLCNFNFLFFCFQDVKDLFLCSFACMNFNVLFLYLFLFKVNSFIFTKTFSEKLPSRAISCKSWAVHV